MEKQTYRNPVYPQTPAELNDPDERVAQGARPPPSYEQATFSTEQPNHSADVHPTHPAMMATHSRPDVDHCLRGTATIHIAAPRTPFVNGAMYDARPTQQTYFVTQTQQPLVIVQQPLVLPLGPEPMFIVCPACHVQKLTNITYKPTASTHLMAAVLCLLGLWCCVCLPYCGGSCMDTMHYCGNCNAYLGTYAKSN